MERGVPMGEEGGQEGKGGSGEVREPRSPWEEQRREQDRYGLELTPAQRLRWLEETMGMLGRWCGRAKLGRPIGRQQDGSSEQS